MSLGGSAGGAAPAFGGAALFGRKFASFCLPPFSGVGGPGGPLAFLVFLERGKFCHLLRVGFRHAVPHINGVYLEGACDCQSNEQRYETNLQRKGIRRACCSLVVERRDVRLHWIGLSFGLRKRSRRQPPNPSEVRHRHRLCLRPARGLQPSIRGGLQGLLKGRCPNRRAVLKSIRWRPRVGPFPQPLITDAGQVLGRLLVEVYRLQPSTQTAPVSEVLVGIQDCRGCRRDLRVIVLFSRIDELLVILSPRLPSKRRVL